MIHLRDLKKVTSVISRGFRGRENEQGSAWSKRKKAAQTTRKLNPPLSAGSPDRRVALCDLRWLSISVEPLSEIFRWRGYTSQFVLGRSLPRTPNPVPGEYREIPYTSATSQPNSSLVCFFFFCGSFCTFYLKFGLPFHGVLLVTKLVQISDRIFGEVCTTREVYEARTKEIVASVVRGFNGKYWSGPFL